MNRLSPVRGLRLERLDVLLASALIIVVSSYTLGFKLDWSATAARLPEEAPAAAVPAAPPPAASQPEIQAAAPAAPAAAAVPATAWARDPKDEAWDKMTGELDKLATRYRGRVAIYLKDLRTDRTWTFHPDDLFPSASLIKVPVMVCVFSKIHDGRLSLNDKLTLHRHNRVGGSGSLKWRLDGTRLTVRELLEHMIYESDNTATSMLIEAVGLGYIQQEFPKMGLLYTGIYQEGMSIKGGRVAHENYTTAREMTMLMEKIYRGESVDGPSSQLMMEILKHKRAVASRLAKGLPVGWEIAHKTGLLRHACHDSAIILTPDGDYALTVLTGQNRNYKAAKDFITRLGRITFRHYRGDWQYYAKVSRRHSQFAFR